MKPSDRMRLTPKQKIRLACERVGADHPVAIPTVLGNWKVVPCPDGVIPGTTYKMPSMATDGRHLWYNVEFVDGLTLEETICIVGHETGHPLLRHNFRQNGRNDRLWNIAGDLAINDILRNWYAGIVRLDDLFATGSMMPEFGDYLEYPRGLSAEAYYDMVVDKVKEKQEEMKQEQKGNQGQQDKQSGDDSHDDQSPSDQSDSDDEGNGDDGQGMGMNDDESDDPQDGSGKPDDGSNGDQQGDESGDESGDDSSGSDSSSGDSQGSESNSPDDGPSVDDVINKLFGDKAGTEDDPFGTVKEPELMDDEDAEAAERHFNEAMQQAVVTCKSQGMCAGELITAVGQQLLADATQENRMDWRNLLQKFISRLSPGGSTFRRPHRRHGHRRDVIIPANMGRGKSRGLVIVDTSGSMGDAECNEALRQLEQILRTYPRTTVKMISCDTQVIEGEEWRVTDFPLTEWEGWKGRGGTDLAPALDWADNYRPEWMVILTDMCWEWWECKSNIPTIWLGATVPQGYKDKIDDLLPFGVYAEVKI